jgi:hypothetical protein
VVPVDNVWHQFQGYNEIKRKKTKELPISSTALEGHAAALLEICLKPCVDVDLVKFCPGGSICTIVFVYQVANSRSADDAITQSAQIITSLKPSLPEYHTRQMKREFKARCARLAKVTPAFLDCIYRELTMDASAANRPDVQERIRLILLGETGLVADLRSLNTGRPLGTYDRFFSKMATVIEEAICADERRHGVAHVAPWLSMRDLIAKTTQTCEPDTPIPSKSLVRLQFTPRNKYTHTALNFTSRFEVQYKIQRRQLRASHPDMHYCSAQFRYLKELAVINRESCVLFCCDDKAKIPFGEPGHILSTGVRGKQSLVSNSSVLGAEDHDVHHKGALTPSVYLHNANPETSEQSFCRGQVTVVVNDNILQQSSPIRHAAAIIAIMRAKYSNDTMPSMLMKFSDGGTDQRNTLESVKCSLIAIFKLLNLNMLIAARCAPGQSWINPAERVLRVMSLLNIALQNCALERPACSDVVEKLIARCNGMQAVREAAASNETMSAEWAASVKTLQDLVASRFQRMSLKEEPIVTMEPVSRANIAEIHQCLTGLFPGIQFDKLSKQYLRCNKEYTDWISRHCRERTYTFQIHSDVTMHSAAVHWNFK